MIITLQWLYEKHPGNDTNILLETMSLLNERGLRWADYYDHNTYIFQDLDNVQPPITGDSSVFPYVHGVNAAQGKHSLGNNYRDTKLMVITGMKAGAVI